MNRARLFALFALVCAGMLFHEIPWFIKEVPGQSYLPAVTAEQLKVQCRVDGTDEDDLLRDLVGAATEMAEVDSRRAFISRQFTLQMDQFPYWGQLDRQSIERTSQAVGVFYGGGIDVRKCPVVSIDSLKYLDTTGTQQTLASDGSAYVTDLLSEPARIYPAYGVPWPITRWQSAAIQITFTAGYGPTADTIPYRAKNAIRMLAAHWYWHRESVGSVGEEIAQGYWACINSLRWSASPV